MHIGRLDHLVLTVRDVEATAAFYRDVRNPAGNLVEVSTHHDGRA